MKNYLLGIDIGTSACKVSLFCTDGQEIAHSSAAYPLDCPAPGHYEQNPELWWDGVCRAIRQMLVDHNIDAGSISAIGVDGQSWSTVLLDKQGEVIRPTPIWMDIRAASVCEEMETRIGADCFFNLSGNLLKPGYSLPKLVWLRKMEPHNYSRVWKVLQSNGYIVWKLTGIISQDYSQGYGFQNYRINDGTWDEVLTKELNLDISIFPELTDCHQVVGTVTRSAAVLTELAEGTPVVAGGLDAACATLGAGCIRPGQTQEQGGQAGGMSICMDTCRANPKLILGNHVVPGCWLLQGGTTGGGGVVRWLGQELAGEEKMQAQRENSSVFALMDCQAKNVAPGSDGVLFLPYMAGERTPIWDENAKGVFYGLDFSKTRGHFYRAAMEGVAFSLRHNLDTAEEIGVYVSQLRSVGGAANSSFWCQLKADITGKPILACGSDSAATLGAAMLAGVGIGVYSGFAEAANKAVRVRREYEPNMALFEQYAQYYERYLRLYQNLRSYMQETSGKTNY